MRVIKLLNIDFKFHFRQAAMTNAWATGISLIHKETNVSSESASIWDHGSSVTRHDYIRNQERKDYPYIALGGIAIKEIPKNIFEKSFPWFINKAHENGAKIHGLGYTSIDGLFRYRFDSVDSTAWLYGNRGGYLYKFNHKTGKMDKIEPSKGMRLNSRKTALHNFNEWIKFQKYARKYL